MDKEFAPIKYYFDGGRDWYNPGFLEKVDGISDISTADIYLCLTRNTNTFKKLREQLKNQNKIRCAN